MLSKLGFSISPAGWHLYPVAPVMLYGLSLTVSANETSLPETSIVKKPSKHYNVGQECSENSNL